MRNKLSAPYRKKMVEKHLFPFKNEIRKFPFNKGINIKREIPSMHVHPWKDFFKDKHLFICKFTVLFSQII